MNNRGNALFLILIAVALFAALSYAITQSGRGGGNISKEQAVIAASQVTQFAASIRTVIQRMVLTGTPVQSICYNAGSAGSYLCAAPKAYRVFDPEGGGATIQCPTESQVDTNVYPAMHWRFRGILSADKGYYIKDIGTNTDVTGRDGFAQLIAVRLAVCQQINKGLGLDQTPATGSNFLYDGQSSETTYNVGVNVLDSNAGEPFACFDTEQNNMGYMYYHATIEQ